MLTLSRKCSGGAGRAEGHDGPASLHEDPPAEGEDRPVLLGQRDELVGEDQSAGRVTPPDERLDPDGLARVERDDRLVMDDSSPWATLRDSSALSWWRATIAACIVGSNTAKRRLPAALAVYIATSALRSISSAPSPAAAPAAIAIPTLAPTTVVLAEDRECHAEDIDQALGHRDRVTQVGLVVDQDGELVAAQPRGEVLLPDAAPDAVADRDQELIARGVAHGVVDDLEVIEVQEQDHRDPALLALAQADGDLLGEQGPVRQVGQGIVVGLVAELLLEPGQLRQRLLELAVLEGDCRPGWRASPGGAGRHRRSWSPRSSG